MGGEEGLSWKGDHSNMYLSRCTLQGHPQQCLLCQQWCSGGIEETMASIAGKDPLCRDEQLDPYKCFKPRKG